MTLTLRETGITVIMAMDLDNSKKIAIFYSNDIIDRYFANFI